MHELLYYNLICIIDAVDFRKFDLPKLCFEEIVI